MLANLQRVRQVALRAWFVSVLFAAAVSAQGAWQGFLKLDGFAGESKDRDHQGWSEVRAFSEGALNDIVYRNGGGVAIGRPTFQPLSVTKLLDRSSPGLYAAIARRATIKTAVLDLVRSSATPSGKAVSFLKVELKNVLLSGITTSGGKDGVVTETLLLTPNEITVNSIRVLAASTGASVRPATLVWNMEIGAMSVPSTSGPGGLTAEEGQASALLLRNLLRNPDAEAGPAADELWAVIPPAEWETAGGLTALRYGALGGMGSSMTGRGNHLFAGGPDGDLSSATQVVDVSPAAVRIDAGRLQAVLSGWLGSKAGDQEVARLKARFRDAVGEVLDTIQAASLTTAGPETNSWLERHETAGSVPSGTRSIEVVVELQRYTGTSIGGVADDLSLVMEEIQAQSAGALVRIQVCRFNDAAEGSSVRFSWPADVGRVLVESADQVRGTWIPESPSTVLQNGQRVFEVPIQPDAPARFWRVRTDGAAP